READAFEPHPRPPVRLGEAEAADRGEKCELLAQLHPRVEAAFLREVAGAVSDDERIARGEDLYGPAVRFVDAERRTDRGGLAGPVGAEQPEDCGALDAHIKAVDRARPVEDFDQLPTDQRRGTRHARSPV